MATERSVSVCKGEQGWARYQDLPEHWVPLPVTTTVWHLDRDEAIRVTRRGFACTPDFSSTIHSATGRTLSACVPDLGTIEATPNPQTAMEGYIALSRVEDAEGLVIAQAFSPTLFQQGPAPFPTLLLEVLKGRVLLSELDDRIKAAEDRGAPKLLKNQQFTCGSCLKNIHPNTSFVLHLRAMSTWKTSYQPS